jgi:hypothetical protein
MLSMSLDFPIATVFGFSERPHNDETPMTIHIGMLGSDGVLLAGDVWTYANASGIRQSSVWGAEAVSKIKAYADGDLAITRAHDMRQARTVSDAIGEKLTRSHWENPESQIEKIAETALSEEHNWRGVHCLIAIREPRSLFKLECGKDPSTQKNICICNRSTSYVVGGDAHNPATFWATRYLLTNTFGDRTVDELIPLAVQIVVDAGSIANGMIRGLEIFRSDGTKFERLSDAESKAWTIEAVKRAGDIEKLITSPLTSR